MPTSGSIKPLAESQGIVLERIESLRCDIAELRGAVDVLTRDYREFREVYVGAHVSLEAKAEAAHRRLDEHINGQKDLENDVKQLKEQLAPVVLWGKIIGFVGSAVMLSIIALIWSLITGELRLIVP